MPSRKGSKAGTRRKVAPRKGPKKASKKFEKMEARPTFSVKRHASQGHVLIAVCDLELLGKTIEEGDLCLEVRESFYGGERVHEGILRRLLEMCTMANLVGKRAVGLAIGMGLVDKDRVISIKGVPHAQVLMC